MLATCCRTCGTRQQVRQLVSESFHTSNKLSNLLLNLCGNMWPVWKHYNWGILYCTTRRPRAHHGASPYARARRRRRQNQKDEFSVHDEINPSIAWDVCILVFIAIFFSIAMISDIFLFLITACSIAILLVRNFVIRNCDTLSGLTVTQWHILLLFNGLTATSHFKMFS